MQLTTIHKKAIDYSYKELAAYQGKQVTLAGVAPECFLTFLRILNFSF